MYFLQYLYHLHRRHNGRSIMSKWVGFIFIVYKSMHEPNRTEQKNQQQKTKRFIHYSIECIYKCKT